MQAVDIMPGGDILAEPVMIAEIACDAHVDPVLDDRTTRRRLGCDPVVAAVRQLAIGRKLVGRLTSQDVDRTTGGISPVEIALWYANELDPIRSEEHTSEL